MADWSSINSFAPCRVPAGRRVLWHGRGHLACSSASWRIRSSSSTGRQARVDLQCRPSGHWFPVSRVPLSLPALSHWDCGHCPAAPGAPTISVITTDLNAAMAKRRGGAGCSGWLRSGGCGGLGAGAPLAACRFGRCCSPTTAGACCWFTQRVSSGVAQASAMPLAPVCSNGSSIRAPGPSGLGLGGLRGDFHGCSVNAPA